MKTRAAVLITSAIAAAATLAFGPTEAIRMVAAAALMLVVIATIVICWLWIEASLPSVDEDSGADKDSMTPWE